MPLNETSGNVTTDAFGGGVAVVPTYIEDVFSTYLYDGTGSALTITNGVDLSGKGGMVWLKSRSNVNYHYLNDTVRGAQKSIYSNDTSAQATSPDDTVTAFNSNGFTLGTAGGINTSARTYASWTFREQSKFFDVVTYTGNATSNRLITHNLGSTPGCIIIKRTDASSSLGWAVYHRSSGNLCLNSTGAENVNFNADVITPTSTTFKISSYTDVNANGGSFVAYLFAHDAGGFGLTGTDNVITCGSYVGTGVNPGPTINLGYEPQFVIVKDATLAFDWLMYDTMRGMPVSDVNTGNTKFLRPSTSGVEAGGGTISPTATGFQLNTTYGGANAVGDTYIYIAIRRGPMKVPTTGTSVFNSLLITGNGGNRTVTGVGFPTDLFHSKARNIGFANSFYDRLRGATKELVPNSTAIENTDATSLTGFDVQDGVRLGTDSVGNATVNYPGGYDYVEHYFRRAPSFFDEVCYTGTGGALTVSHNLARVPELMIVKRRDSVTYGEWFVYSATLGNAKYQLLNTTQASTTANAGIWNLTTPTSTIISVGSDLSFSAATYVAYLFATCAGVSKVGSYTGTGTLTTINCDFTAGVRFLLIKRTDTTGDWYYWDTARGMVSGTDPSSRFNAVGAESNANSVYTATTGFQLLASPAVDINTSGGTYIFLAIA